MDVLEKKKQLAEYEKSLKSLTLDELKALMKPSLYVGRAPQQTEEYINEVIKPVLEANADELGLTAEINV